jgi:tRNA nucleotidyltransferase (CCA-adding enzyme)
MWWFVLASLEHILAEVLKKVNPSDNDRKKVQDLARTLTEKVKKATNEKSVDAEVRIEGSVAKNTWLRDCPEIDVFMQVPITVPKSEFETVLLKIAKKATQEYKQIERFAEHPYIEAVVDGVWVNVVPCYKVKAGKWLSATDRTPFHTNYLKPLLNEKLSQEVRLLKQFMKGIEVYGAEIKVGGFSGYLCELLVINYGSFIKVLQAAADWKEKTVVDQEKHYKTPTDAIKTFEEPLIMVDPVDKTRNVAAAVRKDKLYEFIGAARKFLKKPNIRFFYPLETKQLNKKQLVDKIKARASTIIFIKVEGSTTVPDILWGQLYKSQKAINTIIQQHDFNILRKSVWSNEKNLNIFVFELDIRLLTNMKIHQGPPLRNRLACEKFLQKHLEADSTVSGPRIENGRWIVNVKRKHIDVVELLNEKLCNGGRDEGIAELVSKAVSKTLQVYVNEQIVDLFSKDSDFAKFLTEYLDGKPKWLK